MELLKVISDIILCVIILGAGIVFVVSNIAYKPEEDGDSD